MTGVLRVSIEMKNEETGELAYFEVEQADVAVDIRPDRDLFTIQGKVTKDIRQPEAITPVLKSTSNPLFERVKFKVGDRVKRVRGEYPWEGMMLGGIYTISEIQFNGTMKVEDNPRYYHQDHFEKETPNGD